MHRRAVDHTAIFKSESRSMQGAFDAVVHQLAFGERPAEVRTGICHREDSPSTTNQQNWRPLVLDAGWLVIGQFCFRQHGGKVFWECLPPGPVHADSVLVDQLSTQVSRK